MTKSQVDEMKAVIKDTLNEINTTTSKKQVKQPKQKMEFSKKWLIATTVISIFFTTLSYALSFYDKNPVESLSIEIIKMLWGVDGVSFLGYNVQNCVRAWSFNKSNMDTNLNGTNTNYSNEQDGV